MLAPGLGLRALTRYFEKLHIALIPGECYRLILRFHSNYDRYHSNYDSCEFMRIVGFELQYAGR